MHRTARYAARIVLTLALLLIGAHALRWIAARAAPVLELDIGPNTGAYLDGFTESEERLPVTFRWTREQSSITLPLEGVGPDAALQLRFARFLEGNATVRVYIDGEPHDVINARSGRFRTVELPVALHGSAPTISFLIDDPHPERLGLAVDWLRVKNVRWRIPSTSRRPDVLLVGAFLLTLALGFSSRAATGLGAAVAVLQALWFGHDPLAMVHVHHQLTVVGLTVAALASLVCIVTTRARLLPLLFLLGFFIKGAALFHPSYWYPDVRLHRRYVEIFDATSGSIVERGIEAQKGTGTAYPRRLGGRNYALPYSPLFYVPFTLLERDARGLESAMKHVGLLFAAAELFFVYALASYLLGARVALAASVMVLFLPPLMSRLLFAQWPTLTGHLLDITAIGFAASVIKRPGAMTPLVRYGAGILASFLTYISSLFNMTLFTAALALVVRRRAIPLIAIAGVAGAATTALLYFPFTLAFVTEIIPAVAAGTPSTSSEAIGFAAALGRIHIFYGLAFPLFAIGGLVLARREPTAFKTLLAYAGTFVALITLRALSWAFKDLKELVFIGPFVAITTGACLEALAARGRAGQLAAVFVGVGLIGFGLSKFGEYAALHTQLAGLD